MIGLAETQSHDIARACLSHSGRATVRCPFCNKRYCASVPKHLQNKPLRAKCECGNSFAVLFDSRDYYRKEVRLPGEYSNAVGQMDLVTVTSLSFNGAGLETRHSRHFVTMGETIQLRFQLDDSQSTWINVKGIVKRINGKQLGVQFTGLHGHEQKCLGFYLMP